ncbi:MAG: acyl-ACP--UDP-N-acetylglucosamine O-acyltransferase [Fimbriimonadales bacterium]
MPQIHPLAVVDPQAELADDVIVGPFCIVEAGAVIGPGCVLEGHVIVRGGVTMGRDNFVGQGASIGGDPQDRKYSGEPTFLRIGDGNVFREYVTLHRATGEGKCTTVGSNCYLMAYSHVGHNATLEDGVTMANGVALGGHVTVERAVTIGGMVAVHQYVRIGRYAMVGGFTPVSRDVPPFMLVSGPNQEVHDINAVGLRRLGVDVQARMALHKACKLLFKSRLNLANAIETVRREVPATPEVEYLIAFQQRLYRGKHGRGDQP